MSRWFLSLPFKMFIPRRSPRLAAKHNVANTTTNTNTHPRMKIEELPTPVVKSVHTYTEEEEFGWKLIAKKPVDIDYGVLTKEQSRQKFLEYKSTDVFITSDYKNNCFLIIRRYLDDCEAARGHTAKMVIATLLVKYLIQNPYFIADNARFADTVIQKMETFKEEKQVEDAVVYEDFMTAVNDLYYVLRA